MNKKLFLGMFAAAGMLLATSCSNDELDVVQSGNEAQVTFSLAAEGGIATRAISDGKKADKLVWAVYNEAGTLLNVFKDGENYVGQETQENVPDMTQTAKEVTVNLAKGQTYNVLFWAQDADCEAYNTNDLRNVEVKYPTTAKNNDELRDAFFACKKIEVKGNETFRVDLKRPFAQINVGVTAEDWAAAKASGIEVKQSKVVIKNAATNIDLLDGTVSGSQEVTYDLADIISDQTLDVDVNGNDNIDENEKFQYLSMSYILADDKSTGSSKANLESLEFTFKPENGNDIIFKEGLTNVPVQRNWRTNIIGQILTGTIKFEVMIDQKFLDDYNVNIVRDETAKITYVNDVPYKDNAVMYKDASGNWKEATSFATATNNVAENGIITIGSGANVTLTSKTTMGQKSQTVSGYNAKITVPWLYIGDKWISGTNYQSLNYTFENIDFVISGTGGIELNSASNSSTPFVTFKNCTFTQTQEITADESALIYGKASKDRTYRVVVDGCTFNTSGDTWALSAIFNNYKAYPAPSGNEPYCEFTNNTFNGDKGIRLGYYNTTTNSGKIVVNVKVSGNTFNSTQGLELIGGSYKNLSIENNTGDGTIKFASSSVNLTNCYYINNAQAVPSDKFITTK